MKDFVLFNYTFIPQWCRYTLVSVCVYLYTISWKEFLILVLFDTKVILLKFWSRLFYIFWNNAANIMLSDKVNFTLEQAMKAQRGSRGVALLLL